MSASLVVRPAAVMERYLCIHGHFYQPPRENPWLEAVETQDSAAPFHDWNERVTSECYAPNGASRILNERKKITRIVNNYARTSFNFGPTLLSWLEENAPRVYRGILDADRMGAERFGGHGPAMAQVYNHMILPLANRRDRLTQIRWGIADFVHRFGRQPEGMWLAETAVDRESLDLLAQHGIKFAVLAPGQCKHVRAISPEKKSGKGWQATTAQTLNTRRAYRIPLDDGPGTAGRSIAAFFYDGDIAHGVAFEGLLSSGDKFAARLLAGFDPAEAGPQLVHIATDGESYGHHHRHGEMALSYALEKIAQAGAARPTVYGEFLEIAPPTWEAEVHEDSSWSCFHGVERWRSDCGCSSQIPGWNQKWRTPLREALDWLRDAVAPMCEALASRLLQPAASGENPLWAARDAYISVILDRWPAHVDAFLAKHLEHDSSAADQQLCLQLMELQRHAMLMYTSCGWFFDDISGIETVQILAYAGRVLQLAAALFDGPGAALEAGFLERISRAKSNLLAQGDGAALYRTRVKRQAVGLEQVAAHYAIRSLFEDTHPPDGVSQVFCYNVRREAQEQHRSGRAQLALGRAHVSSQLTRQEQSVVYAVMHFGDQNLSAAVQAVEAQQGGSSAAFEKFADEARKAFLLGNLPEVVRLMDRVLGASTYSLSSLFEDEQRRILEMLLGRTLDDVETGLRDIYTKNTSLLHFLEEARMQQPAALRFVAQFVTTADLYQAIDRDPIRPDEVKSLVDHISAENLTLDRDKLSYAATQRAKQALVHVQATSRLALASQRGRSVPRELQEEAMVALERAIAVVESLRVLPIELNLWQAQNVWNQLWQEIKRADTKEDAWMERFRYLGTLMDLAVDELQVEEPAAVVIA
jgi:alpha-amylase/alpha-mannosidase (GH57 family)